MSAPYEQFAMSACEGCHGSGDHPMVSGPCICVPECEWCGEMFAWSGDDETMPDNCPVCVEAHDVSRGGFVE